MKKCLLDTDTVSYIMRKDPTVINHLQKYLKKYKKITFSIITQYEILRGLKVKNALMQINNFEQICNNNEILPITKSIIEKASEFYSDLYKSGKIIGDADILIASTAIDNNLELITNNEKHFNRIPGLKINNWNK